MSRIIVVLDLLGYFAIACWDGLCTIYRVVGRLETIRCLPGGR